MRTLTAKEAKYDFGWLIGLADAEPLAVAKHWRPVVVVMAEYDRLKVFGIGHVVAAQPTTGKAE